MIKDDRHPAERQAGGEDVEVTEVAHQHRAGAHTRRAERASVTQRRASRNSRSGARHGGASMATRWGASRPSGASHSATSIPPFLQSRAERGNSGMQRSVISAEKNHLHGFGARSAPPQRESDEDRELAGLASVHALGYVRPSGRSPGRTARERAAAVEHHRPPGLLAPRRPGRAPDRPACWGFVAVTACLGGYAVAHEWTAVRAALGSLGFAAVAGALLSVLAAMVMTMQSWRVLLAGLGSPLPLRAASRIMFIGQLGKYLPGSVWPVLAQMELGHAYRVPRHRSASASVLAMMVSLLSGLLMALITLPFVAGATAYRWAFALVPVLLAACIRGCSNAVLQWLLRVARRPPLEQPLTGRVMAAALAWSCSSWVLYGLQDTAARDPAGGSGGTHRAAGHRRFRLRLERGLRGGVRPGRCRGAGRPPGRRAGPCPGVGSATAVALVSRALMTAGDLLTAALAAGLSRAPHPRPASGSMTTSGQSLSSSFRYVSVTVSVCEAFSLIWPRGEVIPRRIPGRTRQ